MAVIDHIALRGVLLGGLVLHKALWEVLKRRGKTAERSGSGDISLLQRMVKLAKMAALAILVLQTALLELFPISTEADTLRFIGLAIYVIGLCVAITGRLQLGSSWANLEDASASSGQALVTTGIYRFIRHPIYTGDLLLIAGLELALNSWLVLGILALGPIVVARSSAEEKLMAEAFPEYDAYRRQSKRFIPFVL